MKINTWFLVFKMKIKSYYITLEYTKDYLKIKFNSDDILPLNKPLKFYQMTITIRFVISKDNKLYPQVRLDGALYTL